MCGIVGYVGYREVLPLLVEGLQRLEYRGYDSAGVVLVDDGQLRTVKAEGKLEKLRGQLAQAARDGAPVEGAYGLGHTRWATHGAPSERNAHPVLDARRRVALIHNGIIENFLPLKQRLLAEGWTFSSDTDTEVVANLLSSHLERGHDFLESMRRTVAEIEGMYAIAAVYEGSPEQEILIARQGPPLLLGIGEGENFLASDASALLAHTRQVIFLENGDLARMRVGDITVWNGDVEIKRPVQKLDWDLLQIEKGGYKHFMLKEIHEQPQALQDTLASRVDFETRQVAFDQVQLGRADWQRIRHIHLLACGTSWHAALIGKFLIEELARIPVAVDYGSEYRYRDPIVDDAVLAIGISQSGETADTLASMEAAKERGAKLLTICNVIGSQATRISHGVIHTHAGPEIGVASTKAFTTQLEALFLLALGLRQERGLPADPAHFEALAHLPQAVAAALKIQDQVEELAKRYQRAQNFLYLGRGINYPIALEGALKLKEISYIHAEGYPAGEMKHGPIALIDESMPTVAIATGHRMAEKMRSNMEQVKARDGKVIALTDRHAAELRGLADDILEVPEIHPLLQPVVNVVPLQLLAYFIGVRRGADVDQPRNLAKSVTVE